MYQFIESICCVDGELQLLELHQARVNRTFFTNYGFLANPLKLSRLIRQIPAKGQYKCRVSYDKDNSIFAFEPYQTPKIKSLQMVESDTIDYRYKYADRKELNHLFAKREEAEDIIIIKNGRITDSYFANLAFFDGEAWWTPEEPLLEGVRRQSLIDLGLIKRTAIDLGEINKYEKVCLINAMLDLGHIEIPIPNISSTSK